MSQIWIFYILYHLFIPRIFNIFTLGKFQQVKILHNLKIKSKITNSAISMIKYYYVIKILKILYIYKYCLVLVIN